MFCQVVRKSLFITAVMNLLSHLLSLFTAILLVSETLQNPGDEEAAIMLNCCYEKREGIKLQK